MLIMPESGSIPMSYEKRWWAEVAGQSAAKRYWRGHQRMEKATESCILWPCYETKEVMDKWSEIYFANSRKMLR